MLHANFFVSAVLDFVSQASKTKARPSQGVSLQGVLTQAQRQRVYIPKLCFCMYVISNNLFRKINIDDDSWLTMIDTTVTSSETESNKLGTKQPDPKQYLSI